MNKHSVHSVIQKSSKTFLVVFMLGALSLSSCSKDETKPALKPDGKIVDTASPLIRSQYVTGELATLCDSAIQKVDTQVNAVVGLAVTDRTFDNTVLALEGALAEFNDKTSPLTFMNYVSPSESLRAEGASCEEKVTQFYVSVFTRKDLFNSIKDAAPRNVDEQRLFSETIKAFKKNGLELSDDLLAQVKARLTEIASLETKFSTHLNSDTSSVVFTLEELKGVPDVVLARLQKNADGTYTVSTKRTIYAQVMENALSSDTRKKLMLAYDNRAVDKGNVDLLERAIVLRAETAKLLGYKTWADYRTDGRMAGTGDNALKFLLGLKDKLGVRAKADIEAMRKYKEELGIKPFDRVEPWDVLLLSAQLKKKNYSLDEEKVREYFPADLVVNGMFEVYSKMLGVTYVKVEDSKAWSTGVSLYEIRDTKSGDLIGHFYGDFFPRDGKYGHAAAFTLISGRELSGGVYSKPISAIVSNFNPPADGKPSLLSHDEVETLFHEFGHIMHQTLTKAPYASLSGSSTARDFVEAPSQMLENWVWSPEILKVISGHYLNQEEKLPKELLDQMLAARDFNQGYFYVRQLFLALLDMSYHTSDVKVDSTAVLNKLYTDIIGINALEGGHFQASFGHLMGGYDAGYYGYLWSEVYAADMFTQFEAGGLLNSDVGAKYRHVILEQGNMRDPLTLVEEFLGRAVSFDAFYKKLGI